MLGRISICLAVIGAFVWLTGANFLWAGSITKISQPSTSIEYSY